MPRSPIHHASLPNVPAPVTFAAPTQAVPLNPPVISPQVDPTSVPVAMQWATKTPAFDPTELFDPTERVNNFRWFNAYVMATLSRECQYPVFQTLVDLIKSGFPNVQNYRIAPSGTTGIGASLWAIAGDKVIYAFPGTQDLSQWVGYAKGTLQANTNFPQADIAQYYSAFDPYMKDTDNLIRGDGSWNQPNGKSPTKAYTGHSLGGMMAAFLQNWHNLSQPGQPSGTFGDVATVYNFGAPAFARWTDKANANAYHCRLFRIVAPPDPVPDMVQIACGANPLAWTWWWQAGPTLVGIPWHIATSSLLAAIGTAVQSKLQAANSGSFWDWPTIMGTLTDAHLMTYYCNQIAVMCEAYGDTPEPAYSIFKQANVIMDSLSEFF